MKENALIREERLSDFLEKILESLQNIEAALIKINKEEVPTENCFLSEKIVATLHVIQGAPVLLNRGNIEELQRTSAAVQ